MNWCVHRLVVILAILLVWVDPAEAASQRVVLITAPASASRVGASEPVQEPAPVHTAAAQIEAELRAAGYDVIRVTGGTGLDDLRDGAEAHDAPAAVSVVSAKGQTTADVWAIDRMLGKTVIRQVATAGSDAEATRVLALQVVEALHASLLELGARPEASPRDEAPASRAPPAPNAGSTTTSIDRPKPKTPSLPPPRHPKRTPIAPRTADHAPPAPNRMLLALGAAIQTGPGDLPDAFPAVMARAGYLLREDWIAELNWQGPSSARVSVPNVASATVDRTLASARLAATPVASQARFRPFVAAGIGLEYLRATGALPAGAGDPSEYVASASSAWFPLAELGAGARLRIWDRFGLLATFDSALTFVRPVIRFGTIVRTTQQPLLSAALAAEASW